MKFRKTPSTRLWIFYAFLFLVGVVLINVVGYQKFVGTRLFELCFLGMPLAALLVAVGQFVATVSQFWNKKQDLGFFYLFQFMLWLFVTWLTFFIQTIFVGIAFHSVPIR